MLVLLAMPCLVVRWLAARSQRDFRAIDPRLSEGGDLVVDGNCCRNFF